RSIHDGAHRDSGTLAEGDAEAAAERAAVQGRVDAGYIDGGAIAGNRGPERSRAKQIDGDFRQRIAEPVQRPAQTLRLRLQLERERRRLRERLHSPGSSEPGAAGQVGGNPFDRQLSLVSRCPEPGVSYHAAAEEDCLHRHVEAAGQSSGRRPAHYRLPGFRVDSALADEPVEIEAPDPELDVGIETAARERK